MYSGNMEKAEYNEQHGAAVTRGERRTSDVQGRGVSA